MTDIQKLKALAEAVRELEDQPEKSYEHEEAKDALWLHMHCHTVMDLIAEIDSLKSRLEMESAELACSDSDGRAIQAERDHLKADNEALRKALKDVMTQVDCSIRETVRDCVNGHDDVQDIYGYCDSIEGIIDAAMSKEASQ